MKAAFTRAYNKEAHLTPYSLQVVKTSRLSTGPALDSEYSEEFQEDDTQSEKEQDAVETDAMIKKKTRSSKPSKSEREKESKKGKGKNWKK